MEVIKTLRPGDSGTKKFVEHYGSKLVAVRYRRDLNRNQHLTTIELIVDEREPPIKGVAHSSNTRRRFEMLAVRIGYDELECRQAIKRVGGSWDKKQKVWWVKREELVALRLLGRVVDGPEMPDLDIV